jgi:hypothetical protein
MKYSENGFEGRFTRGGVNIGGNTPAIVGDADGTIGLDIHFDMSTVTR